MSVSGVNLNALVQPNGLDKLLGAVAGITDMASIDKLAAGVAISTGAAPAAGLPPAMTPNAAQTGGLDTMLNTALQVALNPMGPEVSKLMGSLGTPPANGTPVANPIASLFPGSKLPGTVPSMNGLGAYLNAQGGAGMSVQQHLANHFSFAQQLVGGFLPQFNPLRFLGGIKF